MPSYGGVSAASTGIAGSGVGIGVGAAVGVGIFVGSGVGVSVLVGTGVSTPGVATGSWATRASTVAATLGVGSAEGTSALEQASMRVPMNTARTTVSL